MAARRAVTACHYIRLPDAYLISTADAVAERIKMRPMPQMTTIRQRPWWPEHLTGGVREARTVCSG